MSVALGLPALDSRGREKAVEEEEEDMGTGRE